jgi:hypothetical protein
MIPAGEISPANKTIKNGAFHWQDGGKAYNRAICIVQGKKGFGVTSRGSALQ